ncbi:MAG: glycosyltransferase family 2 protein [Lachnospiraceae bacterium]
MDNRPDVSIIVPVYNAQNTIVSCAVNLIRQTWKNVEIIFADDCSTDNSYAILQQIKKETGDHIHVLRTDQNSGPGGARNLGLSIASGRYIGFVDSDDLADVTMFEKMYQLARAEACDIVDCAYLDEAKGMIMPSIPEELSGIMDTAKKNRLISTEGYVWNKLFLADLINENHMRFREQTSMEDTDFIVYAYALSTKILSVNEPLYRHTKNDFSMMSRIRHKNISLDSRNAANAIYEKLSRMPLYKGIQEGAEAIMIALCFSALVNCLLDETADDGTKLGNMLEIRQLTDRIVKRGFQNTCLPKEMDETCIDLMKINAVEPSELLGMFRT